MNTRIGIRILVLLALVLGALPLVTAAQPLDPEVQAELDAEAAHTPGQPAAPRAPVALPGTVVYFSDFEDDNGGMSPTLDWTWGVYNWIGDTCDSSNYPPPSAYSGVGMWGTRLNTCYQNLGNNAGYDTCINGNPDDDSILSITLDLTGLSDATLSWWEWFDLFLEWDWAEVYANDVVVFQHCGDSFVQPTAWEQQVVDLTPFVGGPVELRFHMLASSVVNHSGWFIDDVMVVTSEESTMHVEAIDGRFAEPFLVMKVQAADQDGMPLSDVLVDGIITMPFGEWARGRYTKPTGWARFWAPLLANGNYEICVDNLTLAGYTYNPDDNVVTCMDWDW